MDPTTDRNDMMHHHRHDSVHSALNNTENEMETLLKHYHDGDGISQNQISNSKLFVDHSSLAVDPKIKTQGKEKPNLRLTTDEMNDIFG